MGKPPKEQGDERKRLIAERFKALRHAISEEQLFAHSQAGLARLSGGHLTRTDFVRAEGGGAGTQASTAKWSRGVAAVAGVDEGTARRFIDGEISAKELIQAGVRRKFGIRRSLSLDELVAHAALHDGMKPAFVERVVRQRDLRSAATFDDAWTMMKALWQFELRDEAAWKVHGSQEVEALSGDDAELPAEEDEPTPLFGTADELDFSDEEPR